MSFVRPRIAPCDPWQRIITTGLRSGRHRNLLTKMAKPNARVKGFASRGLLA
jgi:hypothetical protein